MHRNRTLFAVGRQHLGPALRTAPTGEGGAPAGGGAAPPTPQPPAPGAPPATSPWANFTWDGNVDSLPEPVAKVIRDTRAEAAKDRTTAKETAAQEARDKFMADISKALGLEKPPADPAALAQELQAAKAASQDADVAAHAAQIELDVYKAAGRLGANPDRLLDSRTFCDTIDNLEFKDAAEFATQVEATIKAALEADPAMRATGQAPARQGAPITGGGTQPTRATSLHAAIAAATGS